MMELKCGSAPLNTRTRTRIVGGEDAVAGSWPSQVSLTVFKASDITVYLGRHTQEQTNPNEVVRTVMQIINHAKYNKYTLQNDISLLQLNDVSFSDYIQPVCLAAHGNEPDNGTDVWVTGWGNINKGVSLPSPGTLQEVQVPIVSQTRCGTLYRPNMITDDMLCAGTDTKGACQGDSGGPLVLKMGETWVQFGVVSFGRASGCTDAPTVFTRVSRYNTWIKDRAGNNTGFVGEDGTSPTNPVFVEDGTSPTNPVFVEDGTSPTNPVFVEDGTSPTNPVFVEDGTSPTNPVFVAENGTSSNAENLVQTLSIVLVLGLAQVLAP
uniref:Peptidase S1 domain-containing protein n=1 Tax=Knipowitschia caucasica TaxID=637954 RepID=A0AAV2KHN1_KNICA